MHKRKNLAEIPMSQIKIRDLYCRKEYYYCTFLFYSRDAHVKTDMRQNLQEQNLK